MTRTLIIAAAALALTAGAAQATPATQARHHKTTASAGEHAATQSLNRQQLASLEAGAPANAMTAPRMAPEPSNGTMTKDTPSTEPMAPPPADAPPPPAPPQLS